MEQQQAIASKSADGFLSRLEQAEARDQAASSRQAHPTGGSGPHYGSDPRYREVPRQQAQQGPPPQHILPKSAYAHHAVYRQPPTATSAAAQAAHEVQPYYGQQNLPGAHRTLVSRQRRHMFEPLQSQVVLTQPGVTADGGLKDRVSFPCNLADGGNKVRGGTPNDRPAGGRANMAGRANTNGTGVHHHHMR